MPDGIGSLTQHGEATRRRIIDVAFRLTMAPTGPGPTIRAIAQLAGVSPSIVYERLVSKADLMREVAMLAAECLEAELQRADEGISAESERLLGLCLRYLEYRVEHRRLFEELDKTLEPDAIATHWRPFVQHATALLQQDGVADPDAARTIALQLRVGTDALAVETFPLLELHGRTLMTSDERAFALAYLRTLLRGALPQLPSDPG